MLLHRHRRLRLLLREVDLYLREVEELLRSLEVRLLPVEVVASEERLKLLECLVVVVLHLSLLDVVEAVVLRVLLPLVEALLLVAGSFNALDTTHTRKRERERETESILARGSRSIGYLLSSYMRVCMCGMA